MAEGGGGREGTGNKGYGKRKDRDLLFSPQIFKTKNLLLRIRDVGKR